MAVEVDCFDAPSTNGNLPATSCGRGLGEPSQTTTDKGEARSCECSSIQHQVLHSLIILAMVLIHFPHPRRVQLKQPNCWGAWDEVDEEQASTKRDHAGGRPVAHRAGGVAS
jgi:hypothetical protein